MTLSLPWENFAELLAVTAHGGKYIHFTQNLKETAIPPPPNTLPNPFVITLP
jgi:hypothetical protein